MVQKIIVLDPGHGGKDPGAIGNNLLEKDLNLAIALKVAAKLSPYDAQIRLTRDDDSFLSLGTRASFANNLRADFFLSIHVNAGGGTGFESFIFNGSISSNTTAFQKTIHNSIFQFLKDYGVINRGEKKAGFVVLRDTSMPAVLVENLFIDNPRDAALLKDSEFIEGLSKAIANGIVQSQNLLTLQQPTPPTWDPQGEINKLKKAGFIVDTHQADSAVTWGQFATVLNRVLEHLKK